jgi:nucleoside-diphosphate-sugar epimerase
MGKRVLVTGADGFIGRRLIPELVRAGFDTVSVDVTDGVDFSDWSQVEHLPKFHVLIHLAGRSFVPDSFDHPREFYDLNFRLTLNALELCRLRGGRMIYISSYTYGTPQYLPIDEHHPVAGFNPYAEGKLIGEKLCRAYDRDFQTPFLIVRPFNIYGPGQSPQFLIPKIVRQAREGKITLMDPIPRRDFLHVEDLVSALVRGAGYDGPSTTLNLASGTSYSVGEVVALVRRHYPNTTVEYSDETRPGEVPDTRASIHLAQETLNWRPMIDLETGIARLCEDNNREM